MIHHAWSVLCERSVIDKESNNISLDVIERVQMNVRGAPLPTADQPRLIPFNYRLVSLWYRDAGPERGRARVRVLDPRERQLGTIDLEVDLEQPELIRLRTIAELGFLPVAGSGVYLYIVDQQRGAEWHEVARIPLELQVQAE